MGINKQEPKLLDKYSLSINCLNYDYIGRSNNVKELEKILHVLRSGEEGIFPDLIKFCEEKLVQLCPDSEFLKASFAQVSISSAEKIAVEKDLQDWVNEIKECENKLFAHTSKFSAPVVADTPVREALEMKHNHDYIVDEDANKKRIRSKGHKESQANSFKPLKESSKHFSYSDWDKFNVEEELKKLDGNQPEKTNASAFGEKSGRQSLEPFIDNKGMTEEECKLLAEQERIKGNEAFKVQDYEEAEIYYSRSISCYPLIAALNNRALTNIKLMNYSAALCDCNTVLSLEADNLKALYRRGLAYKETSRIQLAYADFQRVLELDPGNKAAKEKVQSIEANPCGSNEKSSVKIEELISNDTTLQHSSKIDDAVSSSHSAYSSASTKKEHNSVSAALLAESDGFQRTKDLFIPNFNEGGKYACYSGNDNSSSNEKAGLPQSSEIGSPKKVNGRKVSSVIASCGEDHGISSDIKLYKVKVETCGCVEEIGCEKQNYQNMNHYDEVGSLHSDQSFSIIAKNLNQVESDKIPEKVEPCEISVNVLENQLKTSEHDFLSEMTEKVSPFKFLSLWHSTGANKDANASAALLKKVPPHQLPAVLSNKLDGDFLVQLIKAITIISQQENVTKGFEYIQHLSKAPRIRTVSSFFSSDEKEGVRRLLSWFELNGKDVTHLRNTFISQ